MNWNKANQEARMDKKFQLVELQMKLPWYKVRTSERISLRTALMLKESEKADEVFQQLYSKVDEFVKLARDYQTAYFVIEKEYPNRIYGLPKIIRNMFHFQREAERYLKLLKGVHNNWNIKSIRTSFTNPEKEVREDPRD